MIPWVRDAPVTCEIYRVVRCKLLLENSITAHVALYFHWLSIKETRSLSVINIQCLGQFLNIENDQNILKTHC